LADSSHSKEFKHLLLQT